MSLDKAHSLVILGRHVPAGDATVTSTINPEDWHLAGTGGLDSILDGSGVAEIEIAVDALARDDAATTVSVIGWAD